MACGSASRARRRTPYAQCTRNRSERDLESKEDELLEQVRQRAALDQAVLVLEQRSVSGRRSAHESPGQHWRPGGWHEPHDALRAPHSRRLRRSRARKSWRARSRSSGAALQRAWKRIGACTTCRCTLHAMMAPRLSSAGARLSGATVAQVSNRSAEGGPPTRQAAAQGQRRPRCALWGVHATAQRAAFPHGAHSRSLVSLLPGPADRTRLPPAHPSHSLTCRTTCPGRPQSRAPSPRHAAAAVVAAQVQLQSQLQAAKKSLQSVERER